MLFTGSLARMHFKVVDVCSEQAFCLRVLEDRRVLRRVDPLQLSDFPETVVFLNVTSFRMSEQRQDEWYHRLFELALPVVRPETLWQRHVSSGRPFAVQDSLKIH